MLLPRYGIWVIHFHYLYNQGNSNNKMDNVMRGIHTNDDPHTRIMQT